MKFSVAVLLPYLVFSRRASFDDLQRKGAANGAALSVGNASAALATATAVELSLASSSRSSETLYDPNYTETIRHQKIAGNGYVEGSPLYEKQQKEQADEAGNAPPIHEGAFEEYKKALTKQFSYVMVSILIYALLVIVVAYFYHAKHDLAPLRHRPRGANPPMGPEWMACGFAHNLFDFHNLGTDWSICVMAFCCPLIRWADTISKAISPPMGFWAALLALLFLACLGPLTFGLSGLVLLIVWIVWRTKLREMYGHSHHKGFAAFEDICLICCCGGIFNPCLVAQEAREVEFTSPGNYK